MSIYPWRNAPKWAKWAATDSDGASYWFGHKPVLCSSSWAVDDTKGYEEVAYILVQFEKPSAWQLSLEENKYRPRIVCLCGSTRFMDEFHKQNERLTLQGVIVLTVGCNSKKGEGLTLTADDKLKLDELHKRKIDLCDEILVLNVGRYIGESTKGEIEYAKYHGKFIYYLESIDEVDGLKIVNI